MSHKFDYIKFFELLQAEKYNDAHSYYRIFEEDRYEEFKSLFVEDKMGNKYFEELFIVALDLFAKNLNDNDFCNSCKNEELEDVPAIIYSDICACFKNAINQRIETALDNFNYAECNQLISVFGKGIFKDAYKNLLPYLDDILKNNKLLNRIFNDVLKGIDFRKISGTEKGFNLLYVVEYHMVFSLIKREKVHQNFLYCAFFILRCFIQKHYGDFYPYIESLVRKKDIFQSYSNEEPLFFYRKNKATIDKKILSTLFWLYKSESIETPYYSKNLVNTSVEICIGTHFRYIIASLKEINMVFNNTINETDNEEELVNIFGRINNLTDELNTREKIKVLALMLFPNYYKQFFLIYGFFKTLNKTDILNRFSKETISEESKIIRKMLDNYSTFSEESLKEIICILRKNIEIYHNAFVYFLNNELKAELINGYVENTSAFNTLCDKLNQPSIPEVEHNNFYYWQLISKNLIKKYYNSNEKDEYKMLYAKHVLKKQNDEIIMLLQTHYNSERLEGVFSNWNNYLSFCGEIIKVFKSRDDRKKKIIILAKEREMETGSIIFYFKNIEKTLIYEAEIAEVLKLWHINLEQINLNTY